MYIGECCTNYQCTLVLSRYQIEAHRIFDSLRYTLHYLILQDHSASRKECRFACRVSDTLGGACLGVILVSLAANVCKAMRA